MDQKKLRERDVNGDRLKLANLVGSFITENLNTTKAPEK